MTFAELQSAVIGTRFKAAQRTGVKRWLRASYAEAWALAPWPWRLLPDPVEITVTAGAQPSGIDLSALQRPDRIQAVNGSSVYDLDLVDEYRFREIHLPRLEAGTTGVIDTVTIVAATSRAEGEFGLRVSPIPSADTTLYVSGYLRPWVYTGGGAREYRTLTDDGDTPAWMVDHHEFLVPGAVAYGLREENDPTWPEIRQMFDLGLATLHADVFPPTKLRYGGA